MKNIYPVTTGSSKSSDWGGRESSKSSIKAPTSRPSCNGVYLDYAATTPVDHRVKMAMEPYFSEKFGNPGALYKIGQEASAAVFQARTRIAEAIGTDYKEIIFTGSATEANNLALRGALKAFRVQRLAVSEKNPSPSCGVLPSCLPAGRYERENKSPTPKSYILNPRIVVSATEHESVLETARDLEKEGVEVVYIPVSREGIVDLKKLEAALNERTVLVSIMHANNEVGVIQPIREISKLISEFRIQNLEFRGEKFNAKKSPIPKSYILNPNFYPLFHTDAAQSFQYLNCDVNDLGVDLMTFSAHKIYGPKGIGALYAKNVEFRSQNLGDKKTKNFPPHSKSYILSPIITGGGQEWGLRSGTENVANVAGFAEAVEIVSRIKDRESKRVGELCDYLWAKLKKANPKIQLNGSAKQRLPNNLNIYFPRTHLNNTTRAIIEMGSQKSSDLLIKLDLAGVSVSSGAACSARTTQPSHVLQAMGFSRDRCMGSLRFSLGRPTGMGDIKEVVKRLTTSD